MKITHTHINATNEHKKLIKQETWL